MNEVTTVATVGEIRPTLADVVPGPGIVPGQCGVEEIRLLIDGLPRIVEHVGQPILALGCVSAVVGR